MPSCPKLPADSSYHPRESLMAVSRPTASDRKGSTQVQAPKRKRPRRRERIEPPTGIDLKEFAARAHYTGSQEHKRHPSSAGPPRLRSDATPCPPHLRDMDQLTTWLRQGLANGDIGAPWKGDFPRYVWFRQDDDCYEGYLTNQELGEYKGYPLKPDECPDWL